MEMADEDGKNDKSLPKKNVLIFAGRLLGKTYHQLFDEVKELSPESNEDTLTIEEVNKFCEIEKEEFDFDSFMEDNEEEQWGVLYMHEDNCGSCVIWIKGKGLLDYNMSRNPKPNFMDGETDIKTMIELLFEIEDDDWADHPKEDAEEGAEDEEAPAPKKKGKKGLSKAGSRTNSVAGSKARAIAG